MMPSAAIAEGSSAATIAGEGKSRARSRWGVCAASPNAFAKRPAIVVAAFTVTCCPRIARTAISNPSNAPGSRRPGWSAARGPRGFGHFLGTAREIEQVPHAGEQRGHAAGERGRCRHAQGRASGRGRDLDPARRRAGAFDAVGRACDASDANGARREPAGADANGAPVAPPLDGLDARHGPAREKGEHRVPVVGRAIGEIEREIVRFAAIRGPGAKLPRRHPISLAEERIEPAQARKAARHRDREHRQSRVREQALGEQQALRLRVGHWRHAELRAEDAPQVPVRDAELRRERLEARILQGPAFDAVGRGTREATVRIDRREARREFRPAPQARAESARLGRRRAREERAVALQGRAGRAHGPAVDARRRHAHEEVGRRSGRRGRRGRGSRDRDRGSRAELSAARRKAARRFRTWDPGASVATGPQRLRDAHHGAGRPFRDIISAIDDERHSP
jgi:hypothetical protein